MRQGLKIFICLCMLLSASALCGASAQQRPEEQYFYAFTEDSTRIAPNGETVIVSNSKNSKVRVIIKTHIVDIGKQGNKPDLIQAKGSSCTYSRYPCSVVDYIDIYVNGKQLLFPNSVFCDLADLNSGQVFINKKNTILIVDGGDASTGYAVAIEFDGKHIKRKAVYADLALIAETIYHRLGEHTNHQ